MLEIGGYQYTFEDGKWIWKAKEPDALNKQGKLKPEYKDLPRFKLIYEIEREMNKDMNKQISEFRKDCLKLLRRFKDG